jgi:hypothetical protein
MEGMPETANNPGTGNNNPPEMIPETREHIIKK